MSLPIDAEAIAAQTKAEHEYGERLMDAATKRAIGRGASSVTAEDVEEAEFWGYANTAQPLLLSTPDATFLMKDGRMVRCICAEKLGAK